MNFFRELKRRNVYKIAVSYVVVGWLLIQVATQTLPFFEIPPWGIRFVILLVVLGFPIALIIAWAFELTPEGIKRTETGPDNGVGSSEKQTWIYIVIGGCFLSVGLFFLGRHTASRPEPAKTGPTKSIAVLPFDNRSEDKANAYFADGIQDEILTRLAKIGDLKVISRTSTLRYKSSPDNIPEIARQLGVEHVLEGGVQKAGDKARVTVQLIHGATDSHVWAETYDRNLSDILAVESEIAETIARELKAKLTPREQKAVAAKPTDNTVAYEEYLRGLALWNRLMVLPTNVDQIIQHFSRAVELDPTFALGWSFLSVAHSYKYGEFDPTAAQAAEAKEALVQALKLQADSGDGFFAEGMYYYKVTREFEKAFDAFEKARQRSANRNLATEFASYVKRRQGKWDEALRLHNELLEIDPRNPVILSEVAITYRAVRRFNEAIALLDRAREVDPDNAKLLALKAELALAQGDSATAERLLHDVPVDENADPEVAIAFVRYWVVLRQFDDAVRVMRRVVEAQAKQPATSTVGANQRGELAIVMAVSGDPNSNALLQQSLEELKRIRAQGDDLSWSSTVLLLVAGFLKDKATVDTLALELEKIIQSDAMSGPGVEMAIAIARAHLGETDAAVTAVERLLKTPGESALTPALLTDPFWDPLRTNPRFVALTEKK